MSNFKEYYLYEFLTEKKEKNIDNKYGENDVLSVSKEKGIVNQIDLLGRSYAGKDLSKYKIVEPENVIYTKSPVKNSPFGIIKVCKENKGIVSTLYAVYNCNKKIIYPKYLDYYFSSDIKLNNYLIVLVDKGAKNTMNISNTKFLDGKIMLPSIKYQIKIVEYLEKIDNIIEVINNIIDDLKDLRENVKRKLFKNITDNNSQTYRIRDLFERVTEKNTNMKSDKILTISAQDGLVSQEDYFNKIVAGKNLENYYYIRKGDFAYNKSYSKGYPVGATKALKKYKNGIVSTLYICFRLKERINNSGFFEYLFESNNYYAELEKITQEGNRNHGLLNMNIEDFFNIPIKVPDIETQGKIYRVLNNIDKKIELEKVKKENYEELKKGLMQQLLTGKVDVNV